MTTNLNTLLAALYVKIDGYFTGKTRMGRSPKLTVAELVALLLLLV